MDVCVHGEGHAQGSEVASAASGSLLDSKLLGESERGGIGLGGAAHELGLGHGSRGHEAVKEGLRKHFDVVNRLEEVDKGLRRRGDETRELD